MYAIYIILDLLFRNQIMMDSLNSIKYLSDKILNRCKINPKSADLPMVRTRRYICLFFKTF